jgi:hypothetical protein
MHIHAYEHIDIYILTHSHIDTYGLGGLMCYRHIHIHIYTQSYRHIWLKWIDMLLISIRT